MSDSSPTGPLPERPLLGLIAEFDAPDRLLAACRKLHEDGYRRWDAHSPYPVHGFESAMGLPASGVSRYVLVGGLAFAALGMGLQAWVSILAYPLVVAGKPLFSWPAFIPVTFELGILGGALGALVGFLRLARLPRFHHPAFAVPGFEGATDDRFFVSLEATDPRFDRRTVERLFQRLGAVRVETVS